MVLKIEENSLNWIGWPNGIRHFLIGIYKRNQNVQLVLIRLISRTIEKPVNFLQCVLVIGLVSDRFYFH